MRIFVLIALILSSIASFAQKEQYDIRVKLSGVKDTVCYLVSYYGQGQYLKDTSKAINPGVFEFKGKDTLRDGMYVIVGQRKNRFIDILIGKEKHFSLETDTISPILSMKVKGSKENQLFFDYQRYIQMMRKKIDPLKEELKRVKNNADSTTLLQKKINQIDKEVREYTNQFIVKNNNSLTAVLLKSSQDIEMPEDPMLANGRKDSTFTYYYFKAHFWDHFDLSDDRVLWSSIFHARLEQYFSKVIVQHPDTIIKEADLFISRVKPNKELFKYTVWYLTNTYERSKIMGFDAIFVHMVETYYMTKQAYWVSANTLTNISKRAMQLKPLLLGKIAPALYMLDTSNQFTSLYQIEANFTILIFWDTDCGHCKEEMPKLKEFYDEYRTKMGLQVYAVCTDADLVRWKKYIDEQHYNKWVNVTGTQANVDYHAVYDIYSTPVIYLLGYNKSILAKRLMVDQLKDFLIKYYSQPDFRKFVDAYIDKGNNE